MGENRFTAADQPLPIVPNPAHLIPRAREQAGRCRWCQGAGSVIAAAAADYAADATHTARTTANADAGALELLLKVLVSISGACGDETT